jgi:hypothetical protein
MAVLYQHRPTHGLFYFLYKSIILRKSIKSLKLSENLAIIEYILYKCGPWSYLGWPTLYYERYFAIGLGRWTSYKTYFCLFCMKSYILILSWLIMLIAVASNLRSIGYIQPRNIFLRPKFEPKISDRNEPRKVLPTVHFEAPDWFSVFKS